MAKISETEQRILDLMADGQVLTQAVATKIDPAFAGRLGAMHRKDLILKALPTLGNWYASHGYVVERTKVKFDDGYEVTVGQRVRFHTRGGTIGHGVLTRITASVVARFVIEPEADVTYGWLERTKLDGGGHYNRLRDHGIYGGEIVRPETTLVEAIS